MAWVTVSLLRRLLGLPIHPAMRRRECLVVSHRTYKVIEKHKAFPVLCFRLGADIRDELAAAVLLLPMVEPDLDATPSSGGGVAATVDPLVADALCQAAEEKRAHVRFGQLRGKRPPAAAISSMKPPGATVADVVGSLPWRVTSSHRFRRAAHVNVQELAEGKVLLEDLCNRDLAPCRFVNGVDSRVVLGCWATGRSLSFVLNGILKACLGWLLLGRKSIGNCWLASADEPRRFVQLRDAVVPPPGLEAAL